MTAIEAPDVHPSETTKTTHVQVSEDTHTHILYIYQRRTYRRGYKLLASASGKVGYRPMTLFIFTVYLYYSVYLEPILIYKHPFVLANHVLISYQNEYNYKGG